jgi:hypothetical protein
LESSSDDSGVVLTVTVTVDSSTLRENARVFIEGTGIGGIGRWQTPLLEFGQEVLANFLDGVRYENFLEVGLENQQVDIRRGLLNVTVIMGINRERYINDFVNPLTEVMTEIFVSPALWEEIEGEYEHPTDRFAASFHVLETQRALLVRQKRETADSQSDMAAFFPARRGRERDRAPAGTPWGHERAFFLREPCGIHDAMVFHGYGKNGPQ